MQSVKMCIRVHLAPSHQCCGHRSHVYSLEFYLLMYSGQMVKSDITHIGFQRVTFVCVIVVAAGV